MNRIAAEMLPTAFAVSALQIEAVSDLKEVGFFAWDIGRRQLTLSARAIQILDFAPGAVRSFCPNDLRTLSIVRKAHHLKTVRAAVGSDGQPVCGSYVLMRRDGDRRDVRASMRVLRGQGGVEQIVGALIDQTDQRRSEAELRATMSTVPSAMIVIDEAGTIRAFSAAAEAMFGRKTRQTLGSPIEILMPEPYRSEHASYLARYLRTNDPRIIGPSRIMNAVRADGHEFPIELWVGDASTETERLFTVFIRDHSILFETEAKLQLLQNDLLHVARLSAVGELSMSLAHELNQPLGALVNHLETADFLARSDDPADRERLLDAITSAAGQSMRAGEIVKRLRTFITKGEADMRVEPVSAIVQEATSLLSSAIRQKGIALSVTIGDPDLHVLADRVQLQQVIFNLLRNATEALETPGLARRTLSISVEARAGEMVEIAVEDSGPGVGPGIRKKLFTPFSTEKPGGMGVGLSISRRIMEAHGGQLAYAPVATGGSRFSLTLPTAPKG